MKRFIPFNKNGNVEMSEKELKKMLSEAYQEGYIKGQTDQILNNSPDFAIAEDREEKKEKEFSQDGKILIFRATIL